MLPREDDLPQDQPNYFDPSPESDAPPGRSTPGRGAGRQTDLGVGLDWPDVSAKPPPALAGGLNVGAVLQGLKRRWWQALGVGLVLAAVASVGAYVLLEPPYTAYAKVHVYTMPPWLLKKNPAGTPEHRNEFITFKGLQTAYMRGKPVLNRALTQPETKGLAILKEQPDPLLWLEEQIHVETQEISEIMTISMTTPDAESCKALVNAVREAYFDEVVKKDRKDRETRLTALKTITNKAETDLDSKRDQYNTLAKKPQTSDPTVISIQQLNLTAMLGAKRQQLATVDFDLQRADSRLKALQKLQTPPAAGAAQPEPMAQQPTTTPEATPQVNELALKDAMARDDRVKQLEKDLKNAKGYLERVQRFVPDGEPEVAKARRRFADARAALDERKEEIRVAVIDALKRAEAEAKERARTQPTAPLAGPAGQATSIDLGTAEVAALTQQKDELTKDIDRLSKELDDLSQRSTALERLRDEIRDESERLSKYRNERDDLEIELSADVPSRVEKFLDPGLEKRDTKRQLLGAIVVAVGVLAGVCFAFGWWESRAKRINSAEEVARGLGVRVVGAVPQFPRRGKDEEAFESLLAESIDSIRTMLLREHDKAPMQVVMVTSASPGEGKTTVASQLAGSLARAGRRTLLIDCDLRGPAVHQLFELPLQPGLSEVLMDEVHLAEATLSTEVDGLWVVPAGEWDREVIAALAKEGLRKVFERLRQSYDFVVIDSHPVLAATDSLLVGQHADAVLMAVMREVSEAPKVYAALQKLGGLHIRVLGAVVSGVPEQVVVSGSYNCAAPALR